MFIDIVKANRSYRRFFESEPVDRETLLKLIDYARLTPSGANKQALKYYVSNERELNDKIFPTLIWAAYLTDWQGPIPGERPAAYIVMVQDEQYKTASGFDPGIAAQTILLGAADMGLGGCMVGTIHREKLKEALAMPDGYEILLVLALGKPKETVVIDEMDADNNIKYWRDENQVHHVPKRKLQDMVMN
jgi:nitroreductase